MNSLPKIQVHIYCDTENPKSSLLQINYRGEVFHAQLLRLIWSIFDLVKSLKENIILFNFTNGPFDIIFITGEFFQVSNI